MDNDTDGTPVSRLRELDFFLGRWSATGEFHATPFGARKPVEMRITGTSEDRGMWTVIRTEELATDANSAPLTARYLWGYDAVADEFVAEWFDSNGGRATQRSSGWDGESLVFLGTMTVGGFTVPLRDSFKRKSPSEYSHFGETDLGEGWITVDDEAVVRAPEK
ncbi:hypothetical protein ACFPJ4_01360 [Lysinimonas soli]|uniref:DUF1579 domain-containing protein n=1 Tax=Lysinimonas soli TaxID=1074233 RepID=A0ABW0NJW5_9MICO